MSTVQLRQILSVRDTEIRIDETPVEFNYDVPGGRMQVLLRQPDKSELEMGHSNKLIFCESQLVMSIDDSVRRQFDSLIQHRLDPSVTKDSNNSDEWAVNEINDDGTYREGRLIPVGLTSEAFRQFYNKIRELFEKHGRGTILTLRWRLNAKGPHQPVSHVSSEWSYDGTVWHSMPADYHASVEIFGRKRVSDSIRSQVETMVGEEVNEPLSHRLFREAWYQRGGNPRSAVVVGLSAAEIGIKNCIQSLAPDTGWLFEKLQSPSVWRLAKEYLPQFQYRMIANAPDLPPAVLRSLHDGIELRNKVAHVGIERIRTEEVTDLLNAIRTLLWHLDVYSGQHWATEHIY